MLRSNISNIIYLKFNFKMEQLILFSGKNQTWTDDFLEQIKTFQKTTKL